MQNNWKKQHYSKALVPIGIIFCRKCHSLMNVVSWQYVSEGKWCRRRDSNSRPEVSSHYNFRCHPKTGCLCAGLSLHRANRSWFRRRPSSLYTFIFRCFARDCHFTGFPEFERFSSHHFWWVMQFTYKTPALPTELLRHLGKCIYTVRIDTATQTLIIQ